MTDAEIASAIASTRFTVTRLMGELREQGLIDIYRNNYICLPPTNYPGKRKLNNIFYSQNTKIFK